MRGENVVFAWSNLARYVQNMILLDKCIHCDLPVIDKSEMFGYGGRGGSSGGVSETASLTPWTDSSNWNVKIEAASTDWTY